MRCSSVLRIFTGKNFISSKSRTLSNFQLVGRCSLSPVTTNSNCCRKLYSSQSTTNDSSNITPEMISHLERTSLVGFGSEEAVVRLEEAIKFASVLFEVDTSGVKPMDSVLENETLFLRDDQPEETNRDNIIRNASVTEEDYFVAPPGNIPLEANQLSADIARGRAEKSS